MKKYLIIVATIIFSIAVFTGGFFITKTDAGTSWALSLLQQKYPNLLEYDNLRGHLLGNVTINGLKLHLDRGTIKIAHLSMHNSLNLVLFRVTNDFLNADHIEIIPRLVSSGETKQSRLHLPFAFKAKDVVLHDISLQLNKNDSIIIAKLRLQLLLTADKVAANVYHNNEVTPCLKYRQKKNVTALDLSLPIKKTNWKIHYYQKSNNYRINGNIQDNHQGSVLVQGDGAKNSSKIIVSAKDFHLNDILIHYWPSVLSFNFNSHHTDKNLELTLNQLKGTINNQPISGSTYLSETDHKINHLLIDLNSNNAKIQIDGMKRDQWQVNWTFQIPNLNLFLPNSHGKILANGNITGESNAPNFEGSLNINHLKLLNYQIEACLADFKITQEQQQYLSSLQLAAHNIQIDQFLITNLQINGQGDLKKHSFDLSAALPNINSKMKLEGSYHNKAWQGKITNLALVNNKQNWQLSQSASISYVNKEWLLSPLLLRSNHNEFYVDARYQKNKLLQAHLKSQNLELSLFNFLLSHDQHLEGKINLKSSINFSPDKKEFELESTLAPGVFEYTTNNQQKKLTFQSGTMSAMLDKSQTLITTFNLVFPEGQANSQFNIPHFVFDNRLKGKPINGEVKAQITQLHFFEALIPAIRNISGKLMANFKVGGTVGKPSLNGNFNLAQADFQIPKLNLKVNNVAIDAKSAGNDIELKGNMTSGNGNLSFNGSGKFDNGDFPLNLRVQGSNVLVCNQPEIKITASPNLNLILGNKELKLSGNILIPEAKLHPHDFGSTEATSDDIIFIEPNGKQVEKSTLKISTDINLVLGNNILLTYKGINGQILGQMRIEDSPNKATVAYGQLRLQDGNYSIYGKTLKIDYGKLNFTGGPLSNPGLEIRASRSLQTTTNQSLFASQEQLRVGVNVLGTLHEPKITLFSEPSGKPPSDILSYLLLGIPADSVTGTNSELLLQAANTIGGNQAGKLLGFKEKLKSSLGLSELDIGTQTEINPKTQESFQHTAFVLGKYLSPKFYVNYSLDLFDHTNTFKARYLLNRYWTVQSVANTNNSGVDILYTVEK